MSPTASQFVGIHGDEPERLVRLPSALEVVQGDGGDWSLELESREPGVASPRHVTNAARSPSAMRHGDQGNRSADQSGASRPPDDSARPAYPPITTNTCLTFPQTAPQLLLPTTRRKPSKQQPSLCARTVFRLHPLISSFLFFFTNSRTDIAHHEGCSADSSCAARLRPGRLAQAEAQEGPLGRAACMCTFSKCPCGLILMTLITGVCSYRPPGQAPRSEVHGCPPAEPFRCCLQRHEGGGQWPPPGPHLQLHERPM